MHSRGRPRYPHHHQIEVWKHSHGPNTRDHPPLRLPTVSILSIATPAYCGEALLTVACMPSLDTSCVGIFAVRRRGVSSRYRQDVMKKYLHTARLTLYSTLTMMKLLKHQINQSIYLSIAFK